MDYTDRSAFPHEPNAPVGHLDHSQLPSTPISTPSKAALELAELLNQAGRLHNWPENCQKVTEVARLIDAKVAGLLEAHRELLLTSENADETGYVTDAGFVDLEAVQAKSHTALADWKPHEPPL